MSKTKPERAEEIEAFLGQAGWSAATRHPLPGDASTRHYTRLIRGGQSAMLMDQPQHTEAPAATERASAEERRALGYNALARLAGADCARFVAASNYLRARGLSAPEIFAADTKAGLVLLEDLGDALYGPILASGAEEQALYAAAIDALVRLHRDSAPGALAPGIPLFRYDETALLAEADLLTEWFLPLAKGRAAGPEEMEEHRLLWREALKGLETTPGVFVHRDYHALNLLWLPQRKGHARVGMIDFQDALAGAPAYDLVSLLEDARRDVAPELAEKMTRRYLEQSDVDAETFRASAAILAAQRNAKIVGIFARLARRDAKPGYLEHLPRVWRYLARDLEHPALSRLKAWYDREFPQEERAAARGHGVA